MGIYPAAEVMAKNILKELQPNKIQLICHIGDISYARGHVSIYALIKFRFWKTKLLLGHLTIFWS